MTNSNSLSSVINSDNLPVSLNVNHTTSKLDKLKLKLQEQRSNQKLIEKALKEGLDINTPLFEGFTLLDNALLLSDEKLIHFLLSHGANPNQYNHYGQLPLEKVYQENIYHLLLSYHAQLEKENHYHRTPLMQNLWQGNLDNAKILYHLGAKIDKIKWHEVEMTIQKEAYDYFMAQYEKEQLENSLKTKNTNLEEKPKKI